MAVERKKDEDQGPAELAAEKTAKDKAARERRAGQAAPEQAAGAAQGFRGEGRRCRRGQGRDGGEGQAEAEAGRQDGS